MDEIAETIIISRIKSLGEPVSIVSEEFGIEDEDNSRLRVIIDPIDGSKNAINGLPIFCTSIAVADGATLGDVFMGYIVNLISADEFWAVKGEGAWFNGKKIRTKNDDKIDIVLYESQRPAEELPRMNRLFSHTARTRCLGTTALNLAHVAMGSASLFVTLSKSRSFDFAAGHLIVKEAGGICTDAEGRDIGHIHTGLGKTNTILASANTRLHARALDALNSPPGP
jgi:myo-inositol-1(or 4)-monophosphatase